MTTTQLASPRQVLDLLSDFSLEMTGKDVDHLVAAGETIPPGTLVNVTYLEHEDLAQRLAAVRAARDLGLVPVPHVSARRLRSEGELEEYVAALAVEGVDRVFVVGGDPEVPHGPYADALAVIDSGLLERHGVRWVGVAGYPEGHPHIDDAVLWSSLEAKAHTLTERGLASNVVTQFGFDVDAVIAWIEEGRDRGLTLPIRVGVPGPAGIRRLLRYAARFGVGSSAGIARKYGFSIANLLGTAGPDRFVTELAAAYDPQRHGEVKLHLYTFGGLAATSEWVEAFRREVVA